MITDVALQEKIREAVYNYLELYGSFPARIGIHIDRIGRFRRSMMVRKSPPPLPVVAVNDFSQLSELTVDRHEVLFWPVAGKDMELDEVYLPDPRSTDLAIPGARIAKMAKEFE